MSSEIIIIGAGATGLMAARELAKSGKKVTILEARDRIGGRILSFSAKDFGYPAQGGAEFVHGAAPVTRALIREAGLTFIPEADDGEVWTARNGPLELHTSFIEGNEVLQEKLNTVNSDMSVVDFLEKHFGSAEYKNFRNAILKMVEGYEAADPHRVSARTLKEGRFGKKYHADGWIQEGYGALMDFLRTESEHNGAHIVFNACVSVIDSTSDRVILQTTDTGTYEAEKVIVTVPLSTLGRIKFVPDITDKMVAAAKIGFGSAIKLLIKFKSQWWKQAAGKDLSKLSFALSNDDFTAWWTQYPTETTVMVGWMAGPNVERNKHLSEEQLLDLGLLALTNMFGVDRVFLKKEIDMWKVINWSNDPFALGAYSYTAMDMVDAYVKLAEPIRNTIFFAGEAVYTGEETATVEGALGSGKEVAANML